MSEVVTPPAAYALDAMHYLYGINNVLRSALAPGRITFGHYQCHLNYLKIRATFV